MLKSGGAVILMRENKIQYLFGREDIQVIPQIPFHDNVCQFLDILSKALREDKEAKKYSDILTFAFWIRKGNILKLKEAYKNERRIGKGFIFHIAPSNVPINFAYTFVFGLLSGNSNIIKASSKEFKQADIICRVMKKLVLQEEFQWIEQQNAIVVYKKEYKEYTEFFSKKCDVRIIWGGDDTIQEVRKAALQPRATEITFADRYSFAIISADAILEADENVMEKLAADFYNDTYLMDQNACSTPHLICWIGEEQNAASASERFWGKLYEKVKKEYVLEDIKVSDKYTMLCEMAAFAKIQPLRRYENYLYVSKIMNLPDDITEMRGKFGLFFEYHLKNMDDLVRIISKKVQTCAVYGVEKEKIYRWILEKNLRGIDRVVEIGKTLEIGLLWDGYDMIRELSRYIA